MLTVGELIAALMNYPSDWQVRVAGAQGPELLIADKQTSEGEPKVVFLVMTDDDRDVSVEVLK